MVKVAAEIWRDFTTDGMPLTPKWKPKKAEIREWGTWLERGVNGVSFDTRAAAVAENIPANIHSVYLQGDAALGDLLGGSYTDTVSAAYDTFTSADGQVWYRLPIATVRFWSDLSVQPTLWKDGRTVPSAIFIGEQAGLNVANYNNNTRDVIGIGYGSLRAFTGTSTDVIAIGGNTASQGQPGRHNVIIGNSAGTYLNHSGDPTQTADRNILIGGLSGHFMTTGRHNAFIGRDSGHSLTSGSDNVGVGYRANATGLAPIGFNGAIVSQTILNPIYSTAVGTYALTYAGGPGNTALGWAAGSNIKLGEYNTLIGKETGRDLDTMLSWNNKVLTKPAISGTYSQTGTTITINATASGAVIGNYIGVTFSSGQINTDTIGDMQWVLVVSTPTGNQFTITSTVSQTASGNCVVNMVETASVGTKSDQNVIIGDRAGYLSLGMVSCTIVGWNAAPESTGIENVIMGQRAGFSLTTGKENTFIGFNAGRNVTAGTPLTTYDNCVALGHESRVSGSNQCQIGDTTTTTYVYGTVQNRSDARDKADIRDTELGLDFIMALRPVDYRWNMRDDYFDRDAEGNLIPIKNDGSRKRNRFHHGFIAQEVKTCGHEFGGLQDHSIGGGDPVMSLGYDEIIAPLVKAVQTLTARVAELEALIP